MNEMVKKFLLAGDKVMPKIHLRQSRFTYIACEPLTINKEKIQKFQETRDSRYTYQVKLQRASFQHYIAYDLRRFLELISKKVLRDKEFNIAKNLDYD